MARLYHCWDYRLERVASGLAGGDGHEADDVLDGTTTGKVIDRSGHTLHDRTYGLSASETLHQLVSDITSFQ